MSEKLWEKFGTTYHIILFQTKVNFLPEWHSVLDLLREDPSKGLPSKTVVE